MFSSLTRGTWPDVDLERCAGVACALSAQAAVATRKPGGRPPWIADAFGPRQDAESESHCSTSSPLSGFDVTREALFFGNFLLGQQKKVARPQGETLLTLLQSAQVEGFRLKASHFSLLVQRKVTKRKHLARDIKIAQGDSLLYPFSDSPSWLGPKTPAIHGRRPTGVRVQTSRANSEKSNAGRVA